MQAADQDLALQQTDMIACKIYKWSCGCHSEGAHVATVRWCIKPLACSILAKATDRNSGQREQLPQSAG